MAMTHREALEVLAAHRGSHLVITTHGSIDLWKSLSDTPLDFAYVPISMGQGLRWDSAWRWRSPATVSWWSPARARCS